MMNTTVIEFQGQRFEVPVSSKGTVAGKDLIETLGVEPSHTVFRASTQGHEIIRPSDEVTVRPGDKFNTVGRFVTAARNVARINQELRFLVQEYGDDRVLWPPSLEWVMIQDLELPSGWEPDKTDLAIIVPDNYGHGAPLRDCFVNSCLRFRHKGQLVTIGHYFDSPDGYSPHTGFRENDWRYLCLHMEEWKAEYTFCSYLKVILTYLSNPYYPWKGNEAQARSA